MKTRDLRNMSVPQGIDMFGITMQGRELTLEEFMFPDLVGPKPPQPSEDGPDGDTLASQWIDRDALVPTSLNPPSQSACPACAPLFQHHLPLEPLPPADCFRGEGLGVWFDSFVDTDTGGYNPWLFQNPSDYIWHLNSYTQDLITLWKGIGVRNVVYTGNSDNTRNSLLSMGMSIISDIKSRPFLSFERQWQKDERGNDILVYSQFSLNTSCDVSGLTSNVVVLDEVLEIIQDAFRYKRYASEQVQRELNSKSEQEVRELFKQYLACLKKNGIKVQLSTYDAPRHDGSADDGDILWFIRELLTEFDNLVIQPDMYYEFPSTDRFRYWEDLARIVEDRSRIRPFLSTTCIRCSDGRIMQPDCSPANLICDLIHARQLGFGAPYFYISGGVEQRFYEAIILGSWLLGCLPGGPSDQIPRPSTYGELREWLCRLFPVTDTGPTRSRRLLLLEKLGFSGGRERVFNNPMSCVPCLKRIENGKQFICTISLNPRCHVKGLSCCSASPWPSNVFTWVHYNQYLHGVNTIGNRSQEKVKESIRCVDIPNDEVRNDNSIL